MNTPVTIVLPKRKLVHQALIANALPEWIAQRPLKQLEQLKTVRPVLPDWFKKATAAQHKELRNTQTDSWTKRSDVEKELERLLDVHAFAEPLLKKHLKQRFRLDLDVKETFIHLYIPTTIIGLPTDGTKVWSVSLLDAALHNFEAFEGEPDAHLPESGFITRPDANGRFRILAEVNGKLAVDQFVKFCRELDIGRRYNTHLREELGLDDRGKQLRLKTRIIDSQRADLKAALHHASMTLAIQPGRLQSLLAFIAGRDNTWQTYDLTLLSTPLTGPLLFSPGNEWSATAPVVVYIPHDPVSPLKEYPSMAAFMTHLTEQLRSDSYKQFFSRFIEHDQLGSFHWALKRKFFHVIEDRPNAPDFAPAVFGTVEELRPIANPSLDYSTSKISGSVLEELYARQLSKIFNDAKVIAVSTDSEDRKTRHDRWERLKSIGLALFNAALFVIAPFVPIVGELMMLQMAYQLLEDAYEGVRDWVEGKSIEAFEHLFAIVETVLQAAGFAVGGKIVGSLYEDLSLPSPFVRSLKPVVSTDGNTRLWNPDPTPYAHPIEVPPTSKPNTLGLHEHNNQTLLKLAESDRLQHTLVLSKTAETERYSLAHPTRTDAYSPRMEHNGQGAWLMEGEQPQAWESTTLMRRLGHATDGFSDAELQQLRIIPIPTLPEQITGLPNLEVLTLNDCRISLDANSHAALSSMTRLRVLDLSENPLGLPPDVSRMAELRQLKLGNTGIAQVPTGLESRPHLTTARLERNRITELPPALFELPGEVSKKIDLTGNPLSQATLDRVKTYALENVGHMSVDAPHEWSQRVQALYPSLTRRDANRFIFDLPGTLAEVPGKLLRLESELAQLNADLEQWQQDVFLLDPTALAEEQLRRTALKEKLVDCWQRDLSQDPDELPDRFAFAGNIHGAMPRLNARFEHIRIIDLQGGPATTAVDGLLQCFPNLQTMALADFNLGQLPESIFNRPQLIDLALHNCRIRLTPADARRLAGLTGLEDLDLSGNPLGTTPEVWRMSRLKTLLLSDSQLRRVPEDVFNMSTLVTLDLSNNLITDLPADILEMRAEAGDDFDLGGNPLSEQGLGRLRIRYQQTGKDLGVPAARWDAQGNPLETTR
jgi:Leucine-rich repeat (LRR) protein